MKNLQLFMKICFMLFKDFLPPEIDGEVTTERVRQYLTELDKYFKGNDEQY